jgi:hypothetical protein
MSLVKTLPKEDQKDIYSKIYDHMYVIFNAPCNKFPNFPFEWHEEEYKISFRATIENFGLEQQNALIARCNTMLKGMRYSNSDTPSVSNYLKASFLQRAEGGIQFESRDDKTPERVMEQIKRCKCAHLWNHVETYIDFINKCQIRFNDQAFGNSSVRIVRFIAHPAVPICLMLWLLRELGYSESRKACGFGDVIIHRPNGLPSAGDPDHDFHFCCGLIKWG